MSHPCHKEQLISIKRIEGQIRGIAKMIEDEKYCIDILNQIKAVRNSLTSVEGKIVKTHLKECVKETLNDKQNYDDKVEEVLKVIKR
jgi:DNA-binding FrmR family transcriptional regulator